MIAKTYDIVAFGAHPDDLEHAMGGTLIKMRRDGVSVLMVHATSGESGTHGNGELRRQEAHAAAELLGADVIFLEFEDMNIRDTPQARKVIAGVIRRARPHMVFAPYYDYPHMHPDHEELGKIVRGVTRFIRMRNYLPNSQPHYVKHFFYYILPPHVRPTMVIDVSDDMEEWHKVANCYASQLDGLKGYYELLLAIRRHHGMLIGRPYAEAFYSDRPVDLTPINLNDLRQDIDRMHH